VRALMLFLTRAAPAGVAGRAGSGTSSESTDSLADALSAEAAGRAVARPGAPPARVLLRTPADLGATPHGQTVTGRIDALLDVPLLDGEPVVPSALAGAGDRLAPLIDPVLSGAVVARRRTIRDGAGPATLVFVLRRPSALDHDAFSRYWFDAHGRLVDDGRPRTGGYRQNHADPAASGAASAALGLRAEVADGIAEGDYLSWPQALAQLAGSDHAAAALADERRFLDHDRCALGLLAPAGAA
jgi:hypothetical protein